MHDGEGEIDMDSKDSSTPDVDARIMWLAGLICSSTWHEAFDAAAERTQEVAGFDAAGEFQKAGTVTHGERSRIVAAFADRVDPVLSCAWSLMALRTDDTPLLIQSVIAGAVGLVVSADGDIAQARARLR